MHRRAIAVVVALGLLAGGGARAAEDSVSARFSALVRGESADAAADRTLLVRRLLLELPREATLPPDLRPLLDDVRAALRDDDPLVRTLGAAVAARFGPDALPLLPELRTALADPADPIRYWVLETVRRLGPEAAELAPDLAGLLHTFAQWSWRVEDGWAPDAPFRDAANVNLAALVAMGPPALDAARAAFAARGHDHPERDAALVALAHHVAPETLPEPPAESPPGTPEAAPTDSADARTPEEWLAALEGAARRPGGMGVPDDMPPPPPPPEEDAPLDTPPPQAGPASAWELLDALARRREAAVPALLLGAERGSDDVRTECLRILAHLGPAARSAGPRVFALATGDDGSVSGLALVALGASGAADPAWVPALRKFLDAPEPPVRRGAVRALGAIGPPAAAARERLMELALGDGDAAAPDADSSWQGGQDVLTRAAAVRALGQIGGPSDRLVPVLLRAGASGAVWSSPPRPTRGWDGPGWRHPRSERPVDLRDAAVDAIGALGAAALPMVREALGDDDAPIRTIAALALARFAPADAGASARAAATDADAAVRTAAVPALALSAAEHDEPALRSLADLVSDDSPDARRAAIEALERLGSPAEAAAAALVVGLVRGDARDAYPILEALDAIRPDAEACLVPGFVAALGRSQSLDEAIVGRLHRVGPPARGAVAALRTALPQMSEAARLGTLALLAEVAADDAAYDEVLHELAADPAPNVRRMAVLRIGELGPAGAEHVPVLAACLDDRDVVVAALAAKALADIAPKVPEALAALAPRAESWPDVVLAHAARALASAGRGSEAAPTCLALLGSPDREARRTALVCIREIGGLAAALPRLRGLLAADQGVGPDLELLPAIASTGAEGTRQVLDLLAKADRDAWYGLLPAVVAGGEHAVPELTGWIRGPDLGRYYAGASMLGSIGAPARPAIPDLLRLADSGHRQALLVATEALAKIGAPDDVVLDLVRRCLAADPLSRDQSCQVVKRLGRRSLPILPDIARAVSYVKFIALDGALGAVTAMGADAAPAVPALMAALPGSRPGDRLHLVGALRDLAEEVPEVRPALLYALSDPWPYVRRAAADALAAHFSADDEVVVRLGGLLADDDAETRHAVADLLLALGERARPAVPALVVAADAPDVAVARIALRTLGHIPAASEIVRPMLLRTIAGGDPWRVSESLAALGRLGGPDDILAPLFARTRKAWDWRVRRSADEGFARWSEAK